MNGTPSSVITLGYGTWGSTGLVLTLGYGIGVALVTPAGRIEYTATKSIIGYTAERQAIDYTVTPQRLDWKARQ